MTQNRLTPADWLLASSEDKIKITRTVKSDVLSKAPTWSIFVSQPIEICVSLLLLSHNPVVKTLAGSWLSKFYGKYDSAEARNAYLSDVRFGISSSMFNYYLSDTW